MTIAIAAPVAATMMTTVAAGRIPLRTKRMPARTKKPETGLSLKRASRSALKAERLVSALPDGKRQIASPYRSGLLTMPSKTIPTFQNRPKHFLFRPVFAKVFFWVHVPGKRIFCFSLLVNCVPFFDSLERAAFRIFRSPCSGECPAGCQTLFAGRRPRGYNRSWRRSDKIHRRSCQNIPYRSGQTEWFWILRFPCI